MSFASALFAVSRSYFIILFSACQELFLKSFFKIFSNLLHNLSVLSRFGLQRLFLLYSAFRVCQELFSTFFQVCFISFLCSQLILFQACRLATTCTIIHFPLLLSTPFLKKISTFLKIRQKP